MLVTCSMSARRSSSRSTTVRTRGQVWHAGGGGTGQAAGTSCMRDLSAKQRHFFDVDYRHSFGVLEGDCPLSFVRRASARGAHSFEASPRDRESCAPSSEVAQPSPLGLRRPSHREPPSTPGAPPRAAGRAGSRACARTLQLACRSQTARGEACRSGGAERQRLRRSPHRK